ALPLAENERKVTLLGTGSKNLFMRSGAGGAAPNNNLVVKMDQAFEDNGFEINRDVWNAYSTLSGSALTTPSTNVEEGIGKLTSAIQDTFADYGDAAIITFVRIGTENTDPGAGQLDLKQNEKDLLKLAKEKKDAGIFKKVIVLINSPLAMSTDWVEEEEYGIDACMFIGSPGYYGVGGAVHALMGKDADGNVVNPSGHCPDSFAGSASSSAAYQNFGDRNVVVYKEGVYVGYKYYETRYEDCVLGQGNADSKKGVYCSEDGWDYAAEMGYPFGFGLSYTTFEETIKDVTYNEEADTYTVTVDVKNTGEVDGKASVQVYVQQPYTDYDKQNGLGKPSIALMGYNKVDVKAGETVEAKVTFDKYFMATYDHVGAKTYIMEGGDYYFAVGNGAHEALNNIISVKNPSAALIDHNGNEYTGVAAAVKKVEVEEDRLTYRNSHYDESVEVTNQFDDADYNYHAKKNGKDDITYLSREDWEATWPTKTTSNPASSADQNMANVYKIGEMKELDYNGNDGIEYNVPYINDEGNEEVITFSDMAKVPLEGEIEDGKFAGKDGAEMWDAFIKQMNLDDLAISISDNRGILDVKKVLKPGNSVAEGPEGLLSKFKYGDKRWATGFPTGPVYTATFDHEMQKKFGGFYGEEAIYAGVACVNAPGANINRTPYGSRASEYMSEDGILNYNVAANIIGTARKKGLIMNIKHCFLNNQETGRQRVATFCNEQAIREIYLKPFEGALTKGNGLGIMTSYNRIGVKYAACHAPLMQNVMRGEWKYRGLIIDDALTGGNTDQYSNGPSMIYAGTDLFCLDGNRGNQLKQWVTGNNDGTILKCMQRANMYVMYSMSRSWMGGITITAEELEEQSNYWWQGTIKGINIGLEVATGALLLVYIAMEVLSRKKGA
ncbi:MAG: fibronectin type III-like domain-contianing protein, partial [Bacilli bacterium]|nr:fibronectin type III-like domain-contianing protein [Bacilli bacterium]